MNLNMEGDVFGSVSAEIDHAKSVPMICIGNANGHQYVWLDEEQAAWVRDWLNRCFQDNGAREP